MGPKWYELPFQWYMWIFWLNGIKAGSKAPRDIWGFKNLCFQVFKPTFIIRIKVKMTKNGPKLGCLYSVEVTYTGFYCPKKCYMMIPMDIPDRYYYRTPMGVKFAYF